MRVLSIFLFVLFLSFSSLSAQDSSPKLPAVIVPNTQIVTVTSKINSHDYWLSIALPDSYDSSNQSYPVLYLLDPSFSFLSVTEFVRFMAFTSTFPELIVVGIGYPTDEDIFQSRQRDYFTFQDDFLKIIGNEIVPFIDSSYRTNNTNRALIGFASGGEFVFHVLVNEPELFDRYIAINSGAAELMPYLMRNDKGFRSKFVGRNVSLFIAEQGSAMLSLAIQKRDYDGLTAIGFSLGKDVREPALHLSLPTGLLAIYCGETMCDRRTTLFE